MNFLACYNIFLQNKYILLKWNKTSQYFAVTSIWFLWISLGKFTGINNNIQYIPCWPFFWEAIPPLETVRCSIRVCVCVRLCVHYFLGQSWFETKPYFLVTCALGDFFTIQWDGEFGTNNFAIGCRENFLEFLQQNFLILNFILNLIHRMNREGSDTLDSLVKNVWHVPKPISSIFGSSKKWPI